MTLLDRLLVHKFEEVALKKSLIPMSAFEQNPIFQTSNRSFTTFLNNNSHGIVGGFYRRSPWQTEINLHLNVFEVAQAYEKGGFAGISICTDTKYFGGSLDDMLLVKASCQLPVLCNDFIVDVYQIYESKAHAADAVLLMASILKLDQIQYLTQEAHRIGLEVFLQINDMQDIEKCLLCPFDVLVVSSLCFSTSEVDFKKYNYFYDKLSEVPLKIAEGGIFNTKQILDLKQIGYSGCVVDFPFLQSEAVFYNVNTFISNLSSN
ncbi:indole-3-glycerol-phosphate synthase [Capnocytophaga canimorsus]|uniref:indole-3-glycerol phosphate synthase TrpC n=1 Tax=Capnocytophaga canimorsus TaxID=28188 RepID=UPI001562A138|nr:hypothetical protein [Capnocytophaga canimorsus]